MNTIKTNCTDAELSAAVAEHVAGIDPQALTGNDHWVKTRIIYATSADAVLPLLENQKWHWRSWKAEAGAEFVWVWVSYIETDDINAPVLSGNYRCATFARAACFALLKAKGWTAEEAL
ncbi:MAG TPA: hypothetical protein VHS96_12070 [Bacteroidia bacterium]|nr:hypothetical protein [Bacteroidia bacterium]